MPPIQPQPVQIVLTDDQIERIAKISEKSFEDATTYTKLILGLGYAALFAVWSGSKSDLSQHQRILSALLALTSLMFYIFFQIIQMIVNSRLALNFARIKERHSGNLLAALQEYEQKVARVSRHLTKLWIGALVLTIPTGIGAAGVLAWAFVIRLYH